MQRWRNKALVRRILNGDEAAGERFVTEHYAAIYRFLFNLTGNREDAEDLTQQTFLRAWQALPNFRGDASLSTWLHRIAYHEYTHWLRSRRNEVPLDEAMGMPDPHAARELAGALFRRALAQLPSEQREVILLCYVQGLSTREAAKVLNIPVGTVKSRLFLARQRLRELLQDALALLSQTMPFCNEPMEVLTDEVPMSELD